MGRMCPRAWAIAGLVLVMTIWGRPRRPAAGPPLSGRLAPGPLPRDRCRRLRLPPLQSRPAFPRGQPGGQLRQPDPGRRRHLRDPLPRRGPGSAPAPRRPPGPGWHLPLDPRPDGRLGPSHSNTAEAYELAEQGYELLGSYGPGTTFRPSLFPGLEI